MDRSLNVGPVAETLPNLGRMLDDSRLRPLGLAGGMTLLGVGALLSLVPPGAPGAFWANAVAATLVFLGVPLFCLGLAAPEPSNPYFQFGVNLSPHQRQAVATGGVAITLAPLVVIAGIPFGVSLPVIVTAAAFAFVGAALVLTGFIAWTAEVIAEPNSAYSNN
ncbi:hypothetical protein ACFQJ5_15110 [Halomicroarcula sp. GCM10025324]|jgi:archaellum biogenesis protein FlaJ (TadC family)|uniref:hypothetical protein n=1 Tax=Haloarcula TaxID=2237 RepID=UPI0023E8F5C4|nr:hypothetical protein [Halomicroarcula sp. ZS-22-S1]